MFHEPPKNFLYSAYKVETEFQDDCDTKKTGTATAFVLEVGKATPWIVTNRHVIDLGYKKSNEKYKNFKLDKLAITGRRADDSVYTIDIHKDAKIFVHDNEENDVALIEARICLNESAGFHWHFGMEHLATEEILKSVEPFDLVCYAGFPQQHDKLGVRPIIRSGHIASDPQYNYSWDGKPQGLCVAYEGFSSEGSSGSPIFAPARGMKTIPNSRNGYLIGINAGHIPNTHGHSGISYFYKSTAILEIIEKCSLMNFHV